MVFTQEGCAYSLSITEHTSCFNAAIGKLFELADVVFTCSRVEDCIRALLLAHLKSCIIDIDCDNFAASSLGYLGRDLAFEEVLEEPN